MANTQCLMLDAVPMSPSEPESRGRILAEALLFLGMLVSIGASLTVIVRGFRDPFFFALIFVGLAMWGVGFYLKHTRAQ